jgi:hypothetical protein
LLFTAGVAAGFAAPELAFALGEGDGVWPTAIDENTSMKPIPITIDLAALAEYRPTLST